MTDVLSKKQRSKLMRAVRSKNSKIEILFRKALWRRGFRYSLHSRNRFGTPDLVLARYRTVIFIDSCFWHGCAKHFTQPAVRAKFWRKKIRANRQRDRRVNAFYQRSSWRVFRFWEHDIRKNIENLVSKLENRLRRNTTT